MPRYTYRCEDCGDYLNVHHPMGKKYYSCTEIIDDCDRRGVIKKVPQKFSTTNDIVDNSTPKDRVEDFIEETRDQIKDMKKGYKKDWE